jgi:hypothetical protein
LGQGYEALWKPAMKIVDFSKILLTSQEQVKEKAHKIY